MGRRIERVVVAGRDAAAWLTTLGLQRALGGIGVRVDVVELPSLLQPVDIYAGLPSLGALHKLLGLDEAAVLQACGGIPVLGQRFSHWSSFGSEFLHGYDVQRPSIEDIDFLHYWVKARSEGLRVPLDQFSLAAVAARQGRVSLGGEGPESLGAFTPGYHLDARRYAALVRRAAMQAGVAVHGAPLASVETSGETISALLLENGERVEADLFVDASGAEAALIDNLAGGGFTSWSGWLGCDRLLAASGPVMRPFPAFSQVSAHWAGWVGLYPLQDRTGLVAAYCADAISDEEMLAEASAVSGMAFSGDAVSAPLVQGARERPWVGNCIAIGEAAAAIEPLDATYLQLIQIGLSNLIALWPVDADHLPESGPYNRSVASHVGNLRDFTISHYRLNQRHGEPFWDRGRGADGPASLDAKLDLFASRGEVALYDDESFQFQNWSAVFIGHGLMPRSYDPLVERVPQQEQMVRFQRLLKMIAQEVEAMPTVADYLIRQPAAARPA